MKLNTLKKYIFGNILSLYGYLGFAYSIYYFLILKPQDDMVNAEIVAKYGENLLSGFNHGLLYIIVYFPILLFFLFFLLIEILIRKKYKYNIFKNTDNKIYSILFWIGIISLLIILGVKVLPLIVFLMSTLFV